MTTITDYPTTVVPSSTAPDPVSDTALRRFIAAVEARFAELRVEHEEKRIRYDDDITTVALAVAEILDPEGFKVEPLQWCGATHPDVQDHEEAHVIPTQDILNWMGDALRREVLNHFPDIGIRPMRFLPVPHGVVCCVGQYEEEEEW